MAHSWQGQRRHDAPREEMTTAFSRPPLEIRRTQLSKLMTPHNHRTDRGRPRYKVASSSGRTVIPTVENQGLSVHQLNAEGLANAKLEVIRQLADSNQVAVVLLQKTHRTTNDNLKLPGFLLAGSIPSKHHGMASLPSVPAPAIYAGDFNCQHTDWGYKQTTKDGETLSDWASSAEAVLLYDPKEPELLLCTMEHIHQPGPGIRRGGP